MPKVHFNPGKRANLNNTRRKNDKKAFLNSMKESDRNELISLLGGKPRAEERLYTKESVRGLLDEFSRKPFLDFLSLLLGCHPTETNVKDFAARNPDKWSQAVSMFSKMSGYKEEIEVTHNVYHAVKVMSDMDLEHLLSETNRKIGDSHLVDPLLIEEQRQETFPEEIRVNKKQGHRKYRPESYIEMPDGTLRKRRVIRS